MTKQEFWALIDQIRRATEGIDEQLDRLRLARLTEEELLAFDRHFHEALSDAYRWDLWAAACIINGGCSDDGFDYFLGWLTAQGQRYFDSALADRNNAGNKAEPGDFVECEEIWYVAAEAYEKLTGKAVFMSEQSGWHVKYNAINGTKILSMSYFPSWQRSLRSDCCCCGSEERRWRL